MSNDLIVSTDEDRFDLNAEDLYEVLGVARNATQSAIRKAYRRASMKYHPDRNGGTEGAKLLFQKIKEAFETLSDHVKREFYNNTGIRKPSDDELDGKARELVSQGFAQAIDTSATNDNIMFEIKYYDPVADVKHALQESLSNIHKSRNDMQRSISRQENLRSRFKRKDGLFDASPVGQILLSRIDRLKKNYSLSQLDISVHQRAIEFVGEYTCPAEPRPMANPWGPGSVIMRTTG